MVTFELSLLLGFYFSRRLFDMPKLVMQRFQRFFARLAEINNPQI